MKYSKFLKYGDILMFSSLTFNVLESIYFAWDTPGVLFHTKEDVLSNAEIICDKISLYGLYCGVIIFTVPLFGLYRNAVKKLDKNG